MRPNRDTAAELAAAPPDHSISIRRAEDAARVSLMRTAVREFCRERNPRTKSQHVILPCDILHREKAAAAQETELAKRTKAGTFAEKAAVARDARLGEREAALAAREAAAQHAEVILQNRASLGCHIRVVFISRLCWPVQGLPGCMGKSCAAPCALTADSRTDPMKQPSGCTCPSPLATTAGRAKPPWERATLESYLAPVG